MTSQAQLLGVEALASALGCSARMLQTKLAAGELPAPRRIGRRLIWLRGDVETLPGFDDTPGDFLTIEGLAAMLHLSVSQVGRLIRGGDLPKPMRVGGRVRWPMHDVTAFLHRLPRE